MIADKVSFFVVGCRLTGLLLHSTDHDEDKSDTNGTYPQIPASKILHLAVFAHASNC